MISHELTDKLSSFLNRYEAVPASEWQVAAKIFSERGFAKGELIAASGETERNIYFILSGGFRHYFIDENANERTTDFCVEGEFTGSFDSFSVNQSPSRDTLVCFEKSRTVFTSNANLELLLNESPAMQSLFRKIILDYYRMKNERETSLLTNDLEKRYDNFLLHYPRLAGRIPQYQIASFLNMTPETLSRIRSARAKIG